MTITIIKGSCRVCLKIPSPSNRHNFQEIADKFTECSGIIIPEVLEYANSICKSCLVQLQSAYNFRSLCKKSENTIQTFLRSQSFNKNRIIISINSGKTYTLPKCISLKVVKIEQNLEINDRVTDNKISLQTSKNIEPQKEVTTEPQPNRRLSEESFGGGDLVINENDSIEENSCESENPPILENRFCEKINKAEEYCVIDKIEPYIRPNIILTNKRKPENVPTVAEAKDTSIQLPPRKKPPKLNQSLVCDICGNLYQKHSQLRDHMQWHRGEKEYECEICGKLFLRKSYMLKHFRKHDGIKPYKCNLCSRQFFCNGERQAHERTHSGIRKYNCKVCGKLFMYSQALKNHSLIHEEIKLHKCKDCGKEFRLMHHLKQHLTTKVHQSRI